MKIAKVSASCLKVGNTSKKRSALLWFILAEGCRRSAGTSEKVLLIDGFWLVALGLLPSKTLE